MAATKRLAENEANGAVVDESTRPSKKSKVAKTDDDAAAVEKARLKKEKKDKKKEKKRKVEHDDVDMTEAAAADDADAAEKERKKAKKKEKKEKKLKEAAEAEQAKPTEEDTPIEEQPKKSKKEKKNKEKSQVSEQAASSSSGSREYAQTMSLNNVPQSEIDAFIADNQIVMTDPTNKLSNLRPVIEFRHLPSTNLLEKKPSPFANYKAPTPIQAASWPFTLSGRDAVGVAETGSGKTMAFALPCVEVVSEAVNADGGRKGKSIKAVVVSPTRELAMQTHEQLERVAAIVGLKCVCIYGGASKDDQRALLRRGADIIVATPGRLKDFMSDDTVILSDACFVVLDEADRMLDKGFEDDIKLILGSCAPLEKRQTLMFTATWPQSVQALASTFMADPVKITIGSGGKETASGAVELQANTRITQRVEVVDPRDKEFRLLQILREHQQGGNGKQKNDRILVFCLYKKEATRVEQFLSRKGIRVGGIHGDLKQEQRTRSLEAFKTGQTPVLVATDVAARGLDIPEVKLVVNVTFPLTIEDYVHRIGRTGRAGKSGEAITLFTVQDKTHSGSLVNILKGANQPVPEDLLKFGTTVKKKAHDMYGAFFKDVDMNQKSTKITFD